MARVIEITTPLGADVLLFHRIRAREETSRLFEYEIDLLSRKADVDLDKILAANVTVKLELPEGKTRRFNGYVTRFAQVGMFGRYHLYRAMVRPWLWFLTRGAKRPAPLRPSLAAAGTGLERVKGREGAIALFWELGVRRLLQFGQPFPSLPSGASRRT